MLTKKSNGATIGIANKLNPIKYNPAILWILGNHTNIEAITDPDNND